ncbi:MAG: S-methyl-5'-thioadenosine phosphorylase [Acidobacteriota bacterium]
MEKVEFGIIGGSGFYQIDGLTDLKEVKLETPFGSPSDSYFIGTLEGRKVAFLSRHGRGHKHIPSDVNFRANIYGFKMLGTERIISMSAVGSMKEEIKILDIVIIDQYIDRTYRRQNTFFGNGIAGHISFAHPICPVIADYLYKATEKLNLPVHEGGIYLCIEGPQFSSKAESFLYRSWGVDVIGMTNATEAKLAREAEMCYATIAMSTDYDCWHESEEAVNVEMLIENLNKNAQNAKRIIKEALKIIPIERTGCECKDALKTSLITRADLIPQETKEKVELIIKKYIK